MPFVTGPPVRNLADIRRLEREPVGLAVPVGGTYDIFAESARAFGQKTALTFLKTADPQDEPVRISYAGLFEGITRTANLFHRLGLGPTDAVAILLPACIENHFVLWGAEAAGIAQPLNPLLTVDRQAELVAATGVKILVAWGTDDDSGYWSKALELRERMDGLKLVRVAPAGDAAPTNSSDFGALIAAEPADRLVSGRSIAPGDTAAYFHTGGTTGSPKIARHTHFNQVFTAWASVQLQGMTPQDVTINGYPLFHVAGVLPASLTSLSAGVEIVIPTTTLLRNPDVRRNYWKIVEKYRVTSLSAVPTVLAALAQTPLDGADISSINYCRTGAAALPPELAQRFEALFGLHVHESLGMTEMAGISTIRPPGVRGPAGCVGFPIPYARVKISGIGADGAPTGEEAPTGEHGMILFKSPNVFPGYLDADATKETFTGDGWLMTGDVGFLDDLGMLHLTGRAKDLIIRSGHNIDPKTIEDALGEHPAVLLCAAVGAPDAYAGELPVAFASLKPGAQAVESELHSFVAARVDEAPARPKSVTVVDAIPVTNVGKIFKPELRRLAAENVVRDLVADGIGTLRDIAIDSGLDRAGTPSVTVTVKGSAGTGLARRLRTLLAPLPVLVTVRNGGGNGSLPAAADTSAD